MINTSENLRNFKRCLKKKLLKSYLKNWHFISETLKYEWAMVNPIILDSDGSNQDSWKEIRKRDSGI